MKLSVLIPMYNEAETVLDTAKKMTETLDAALGHGEYEVVFCDDGSRDGCRELLDSHPVEGCRTVGYKDNRGKGSAIRYGIMQCEGDKIVYTDCDLAYGTQAVVDIWNASGDNDVEIGCRTLGKDGYSGYTPLRKFMSKAYIKVISILAGFRYSDSQCGLKCLKREAARDIFSRCTVDGFAFDLEMLILADKLGYKVGEFPAKIICNRDRGSKVSPIKDTVKMLKDVMKIKKIHKDVGKEK